MSKINFELTNLSREQQETVEITGDIYRAKIFTRKNKENGISRWFYIPFALKRLLHLTVGQTAYFYVVENTTLLLSFNNPNLKKQKTRKIGYAKNKETLTLCLPCTLLDKKLLDKIQYIQLINPIGGTSCEWQIRLH